MSMLTQPLGQALTPRKSRLLPTLLLALGLIIALGAAGYGYLESRRTETVIIAVRSVPFGQQISADDLGMIELPLHRPIQLAGISNFTRVIGMWAARMIGPNDLVQPTMLLDRAPDQPVYSSGQQLDKDTVPVPFATTTIGPLTEHDFVNVGFSDPSGDPNLCLSAGGTGMPTSEVAITSSTPDERPRPFACRLLQRLKVLYVDSEKGVAYLQMTPYQAHAIWAIQAATMPLWGERYGATSDALPTLDRLDASQIDLTRLTMSVTETLKLYTPNGIGGAIPGDASAIPGQPPITAPTQATAAPTATKP